MSSTSKLNDVRLEPSGSMLAVRGEGLHSMRTQLFFSSVLGATLVQDGWDCQTGRRSMYDLVVLVHDWLERQGVEVTRAGFADEAVRLEQERRVGFARTKDAAAELLATGVFERSTEVQAALESYGWSPVRQLREHQMNGVAHALSAINAANFSVPGSGKTTTALASAVVHLAEETIDLVCVIGPVACFEPWESETAAAIPSGLLKPLRVRGSARQRSRTYRQLEDERMLLLSYATAANDVGELQRVFRDRKVMLILDESHRIKRFKGGLWAPAMTDLASRARIRMILSGTPMPQSGKDLYTQLNVLWPDQQLTGTRDAFAARVDLSFDAVLTDIRPFISRTSKEALGLPPYQIETIQVPLAPVQSEVYELITNRFRKSLEDAPTWKAKIDTLRRGRPVRLLQAATNPELLNSVDSNYQLPRVGTTNPTLMERLARYLEHEQPGKVSAALGLVSEIASRSEKVVCWSNFVPNLDYFAREIREQLGLPVFQIDGRVPVGQTSVTPAEDSRSIGSDVGSTREYVVRDFLGTDGPAVLVTNPASCSESISLHRSCRNAIYLDRTYDCSYFLQSIDRIHRLGLPPDAVVRVYILQATLGGNPTIDHLVASSLQQKESTMRELLEGAELQPLVMSDDPAVDADGSDQDLAALLRYLLGEVA